MLVNTKTIEYYEIAATEYYEIAGVIHNGVWNLLTQNMPASPATLDIHPRVWYIRDDMYHTLTQLKTYPFDHYNQGDLC